jgi:hypothetical protein
MDHDRIAAAPPQAVGFDRREWPVLLAVLAVVALPYLQTYNDTLMALDDAVYLGPGIRGGFSWTSLRWAFGYHEANWHPLTWLSHMLDWQLSP